MELDVSYPLDRRSTFEGRGMTPSWVNADGSLNERVIAISLNAAQKDRVNPRFDNLVVVERGIAYVTSTVLKDEVICQIVGDNQDWAKAFLVKSPEFMETPFKSDHSMGDMIVDNWQHTYENDIPFCLTNWF